MDGGRVSELVKSRVLWRKGRVRVCRSELVPKRYVCYELQLREHSCCAERWVTIESYDYYRNARRIAADVERAIDGWARVR